MTSSRRIHREPRPHRTDRRLGARDPIPTEARRVDSAGLDHRHTEVAAALQQQCVQLSAPRLESTPRPTVIGAESLEPLRASPLDPVPRMSQKPVTQDAIRDTERLEHRFHPGVERLAGASDVPMSAVDAAALTSRWRQEKALPVLVQFRAWLQEQRPVVLPKSPIGEAISYTLGNWDALARYTGDGRLAIDNNPAERSLRGIAITRKNFLFLGSEAGGERAALLYTLLETAKLNGLDPEAYLADVIDRMAKGHPINRLAELLPWNWQRQPAKLAA